MQYKVVIRNYDFNLNKLLDGKVYDYRTKRYRNPVKAKGDSVCMKNIFAQMRGVHIDRPIVIHYNFYCKNKKMDKMNIFSACDKSFEDALQKCKVIKNDGWNEIRNVTHDFFVDVNDPRVVIIIEEV